MQIIDVLGNAIVGVVENKQCFPQKQVEAILLGFVEDIQNNILHQNVWLGILHHAFLVLSATMTDLRSVGLVCVILKELDPEKKFNFAEVETLCYANERDELRRHIDLFLDKLVDEEKKIYHTQ